MEKNIIGLALAIWDYQCRRRPFSTWILPELNKSMRSGTPGTIVTYDLDTDGDNLPLGLTREDAEILWYALSSSGNFEGGISGNGKNRPRDIIFWGRQTTWAIMSGNWNGLDDFRSQMEVLIENLQDPMLAILTRGALEQFFKQVNGAVEEGAVPPASKFQSQAPVHKMKRENRDGTYSITLSLTVMIGGSPRLFMICQKVECVSEHGRITFTCTTGNPDIGLVRTFSRMAPWGLILEVKPNSFKICIRMFGTRAVQ